MLLAALKNISDKLPLTHVCTLGQHPVHVEDGEPPAMCGTVLRAQGGHDVLVQLFQRDAV